MKTTDRIDVYYWSRDDSRDDFTVSLAIISNHLDSSGSESQIFRIERGRHGKPGISSSSGRDPVFFNLSHSSALACVAVSTTNEVGIDIELISLRRDYRRMAGYAFTPKEAEDLEAMTETELPRGFTAVWTRKESIIKALGGSAAILLDRFEVSRDPSRVAGCVVVPGYSSDLGIMYRDLPFGTRYRGTVAWRSSGTPVDLRFHRIIPG